MNEAEALLSTLRDIQEPAAPTGVSLWLIAANVVALLLLILALLARWHRLREGWRIEARRTIKQARQMNPGAGLLQLASLLRQILIHRQEPVQDLDGQAWLATLDEHFSTDWFTVHEGRLFGDALYRPSSLSEETFQHLCDHVLRLVDRLPAIPGKR